MTTETTVMAILERANPVPPGELVDVPVGATRYLETALEQRSEPMTIVDPTPTRLSDRPPRRRWPLIAVAASVVAIVVASIALIVATRDDATTPVDQPEPPVPPTIAPAPTTAAATEPDAAQAVVDEFFATYNSGVADDLFALLPDDAVIMENFFGGVPPPSAGAEDRAGWELWDELAHLAGHPVDGTAL